MKTPPVTLRWTSPLGPLLLAASATGLSGIWFLDQKHFPSGALQWNPASGSPVLTSSVHWLERYFAGDFSAPSPPLDLSAGTAFHQSVWCVLANIPPGETRTYGHLAASLGRPAASRAVGAAVGRNPLSLLLPCHRVIGSSGSLTGYAGGLERKRWLLQHESSLTVGKAEDRESGQQ